MTRHDETRSTRRLRNASVATNFGGFFWGGLTLAGWLPNFTGWTLAVFGNIFLGTAEVVLGLSAAFTYGSRDPDHVAVWNGLSIGALAAISATVWFGWSHLGTVGKTILVLLIFAAILLRIHPGLRAAPAAVDAHHDRGGRRGV